LCGYFHKYFRITLSFLCFFNPLWCQTFSFVCPNVDSRLPVVLGISISFS
jgi:hypothetical protein